MGMSRHSFLAMGSQAFHRQAYVDWGAPRNPRVLACYHGLTRTGRDFDYLAAALEDSYRVVCPDVLGRGASAWAATAKDYHTWQYVADATALLALSHDLVPATRNCDELDPECDLDYISEGTRKLDVEHAVCNCIAFGSKNSALVLRRP